MIWACFTVTGIDWDCSRNHHLVFIKFSVENLDYPEKKKFFKYFKYYIINMLLLF